MYARDSMEAEYDLEMQNEDQGNLPLRSRFYQAEMDAAALKPGEDFKRLRPSYVILSAPLIPLARGTTATPLKTAAWRPASLWGTGRARSF